ncbi:hypothetical protein D3C80_1177990 [compost metagenome]
MAETGLPGRPKNQAFGRRPKAKGLPGLMASFQKPISPSSSSNCLVKSASPTETPPVVIRASASRSAWMKAARS